MTVFLKFDFCLTVFTYILNINRKSNSEFTSYWISTNKHGLDVTKNVKKSK